MSCHGHVYVKEVSSHGIDISSPPSLLVDSCSRTTAVERIVSVSVQNLIDFPFSFIFDLVQGGADPEGLRGEIGRHQRRYGAAPHKVGEGRQLRGQSAFVYLILRTKCTVCPLGHRVSADWAVYKWKSPRK